MKTPETPAIPPPSPPPPMPAPPEMGGIEEKAKSDYLKRLIEMRRSGRASTIATGGLGLTTKPLLSKPALLGR